MIRVMRKRKKKKKAIAMQSKQLRFDNFLLIQKSPKLELYTCIYHCSLDPLQYINVVHLELKLYLEERR
jgi:hypothetical protein